MSVALSGLRDSADDLDTDWEDRPLSQYAKDERRHKLFAARRNEALARVDGDRPLDGRTPVEREWSGWLRAYAGCIRRAVAEESRPDPSEILRSVLHMHCNRALRPAPDVEATM